MPIRSLLSPLLLARVSLLLLALLGYGLTMARTVSFWDCGEFIAASHVLGIPHPPGTPFFVMLGRVFDLLLGSLGGHALAINALSACASALGALLVLEITVLLFRGWRLTQGMRAALGFFAGSLTLFGSTYWSNAVEAEVYGLSMCLLLLGVWVLLRWDMDRSPRRDRWLVFFVYLSFLGTGVHTYSMLSLPVAWLFVGARSGRWTPGRASLGSALVAGLSLLYFLNWPWHFGLTPSLGLFSAAGLATLAWGAYKGEWKDPLFWSLGCFLMVSVFMVQAFLVGLLLSIPLLGLTYAIHRLRRRYSHAWGLALLLLLSAALGYSVQLYLPLRSATNPVLDENNPEDWQSLLDLLERRQYGSMGMLERAFYRRGEALNQLAFHPRIGYLGYHLEQFMASPLGAQKPAQPASIGADWLQLGQLLHRLAWELALVGVLVAVWTRRRHPQVMALAALFGLSSLGLVFYVNFADGTRADSSWAKQWHERLGELRPSLPEGIGDLPPLPELRGAVDRYLALPTHLRERWLESPSGAPIRTLLQWRDALAKKGLSMPMPPGPVHGEVRERDYFYTPAFLFYAVMLGLALGHLGSLARSPYARRLLYALACMAWLIPFLTHFRTHDRSEDSLARDFAYNVLSSVPQGGLLFTYGDNDTFPLWYMQMVEGFRTDVTLINTSLAGLAWYRTQVMAQHPSLSLGSTPLDSIAAQAGRTSLSPTVDYQDTSYRLSLTPTWRPSESELFVALLVANNWPAVPVCFMYTADPDELGELSSHLPLAGLVRELGLDQGKADSLLVRRLSTEYLFKGLESRDWRYQEASSRVVASYRWLVQSALQNGLPPMGSDVEQRLKELDQVFAK